MSKLPLFFLRRYDSHKIEKVMRRAAIHSYWDTKNKDEFKVDLIKSAVDTFFYMKYKISPYNSISEEDWEPIIDFMSDNFGPLID